MPAIDYQSGGPLRWEARVDQTVYSAATGNLAQESGIYRYELDLDTLTLYQSFTPTESVARDASFAARPLSTTPCGKSREELTDWLAAEPGSDIWQYRVSTGRSWTDADGDIAYLVTLSGTAHTEQYQLYLRFADGQEALLPLPNRPNSYAILAPAAAGFVGGAFTYDIDAGDLGTYHYTVDLSARTIAMTVTQA